MIINSWSSEVYKNIALIVLDGMGTEQLDVLSDSVTDYFYKNKYDTIDTIVPSTTVAATTTLRTGLLPVSHGLLGWSQYYKESGEIVENFTNCDFYSGESSHLTKPPLEKMPALLVDQINDISEWSAFEVMPQFITPEHNTVEKWCSTIEKIANTKNANKNYIYAYWPEPDSTNHDHGILSGEARNCICNIRDAIINLQNNCPDTLFIITADHGHIDTLPLFIEDFTGIADTLIMPISCEARCTQFFVKPEAKNSFERIFYEIFSEKDFLLINKETFKTNYLHWYSAKNRVLEDESIGDYVAIGIGNKSLHQNQKAWEEFGSPASEHAGGTASEMQVPLIILNNK